MKAPMMNASLARSASSANATISANPATTRVAPDVATLASIRNRRGIRNTANSPVPTRNSTANPIRLGDRADAHLARQSPPSRPLSG